MSSVLPGYEYDIFISYRQKDNKHDGWVTEFVEQLKDELESTFKEDISVYFDVNPHDGLLETHNVEASLKEKLKCLIFIPIISQTYCDPRSFAWVNEFCAYNQQAQEDKFGRDIKIRGGNIASRIIPIKIHDLEKEDNDILENELGGFLRCIDFIFKSAGVNRPLRANEDHPHDNLNKTYYRDQINKVAHAVKEIMTAVKKQSQHSEGIQNQPLRGKPVSTQKQLVRKYLVPLLLLILVTPGIFFVTKLFVSQVQQQKSIAVLPFTNLSKDTTQEYFCEGMVDEILDRLFRINDLQVTSRTSSMRYKDSKQSIREIAGELGVSTLLEGSVRKNGNSIRITVQLIDAKKDVHLWSKIYDNDLSDIFKVQSDIAQKVADELKMVISPEGKLRVDESKTNNPEAYNLYLQGRYFWGKRTKKDLLRSLEYFEKSIALDPVYAMAYAGLADVYLAQTVNSQIPWDEGFPKAKKYALKAIDLNNNLAEAHTTLGNILWANEMKWEEAKKELIRAIDLNPNYAEAHYSYAQLLDILRKNSEARVQMNLALKIGPFVRNYHYWSAFLYYNEGKLSESVKEYQKVLELDPPNAGSTNEFLFYCYLRLSENNKAIESLKEAFKIGPGTSYLKTIDEVFSHSGINGILHWLKIMCLSNGDNYDLARFYSFANKNDSAIYCLEKYSQRSKTLYRINNMLDFENLHADPRFQALMKKCGLSAYQKIDN